MVEVLEATQVLLLLFTELVKKRQLPVTPPPCDTPLSIATQLDVVKVAKGFVCLVMSSQSEEEAVTRCIDMYPLLKELSDEHPVLFEELLVLTGVRILKDSRRYATLRLFFGAGESLRVAKRRVVHRGWRQRPYI